MTESETQSAILNALKAMPHVRCWRANCGRVGHVRYGVPGQGDISGIVRRVVYEDGCGLTSYGVRLEVEVKTATGKLSPKQVQFGDMIREMGGIYIVARSVDDVLDVLNRKTLN